MSRKIAGSDLDDPDRQLVIAARDASRHAYAPYSGFAVGAAARSASGTIYSGANLENASYGVTICAEVSALTAASSAGDMAIETIAVVGHRFSPSPDHSQVVTPCGRCRQIIAEFGKASGRDVRVLACNGSLTEIVEYRLAELIPDAFGPDNLGTSHDDWAKMRAVLMEQLTRLTGGVH